MKPEDLPTAQFVKIFYVGHSGSGKTGSLISLIEAGYNIRVLDLDIGIEPLLALIRYRCPERMRQLDVIQVRDKIRMSTTGPKVDIASNGYIKATQALDKWDDGTDPSQWGPETVFVLDTLTGLGRMAYNWADKNNPTYKDNRLLVGLAQRSLEAVLGGLFGDTFLCHVIVISHIDERKIADGSTRGYIQSIGEALGPRLPALSNTWIAADKKGQGNNVKRYIRTLPTAMLDLKNPSPFKVEAEYPLDTGLASLFALLRGSEEPKNV